MTGYNWVDYILLAVFFIAAMRGIVRGGAREIISIFSWIAAYLVAGAFSHPVASYFASTAGVQQALSSVSGSVGSTVAAQIPTFTLVASFCILFFGTLVVGSLIGSLIGRAVDSVGLGIVNRLVGAVVGLAKGYLMNVVLIFLVQLTAFGQQPAWTQSSIVTTMQPAVQWFGNLIQPGIERIKSNVQNLNSNLQNSVAGFTHGN